MTMDDFELFQQLRLKLAGAVRHQHLELLTNHENNFALVDNGIKWIPHLMRNCGVNQAQKLTFGFGGIVEDVLGNVYEAKHHTVYLFIM